MRVLKTDPHDSPLIAQRSFFGRRRAAIGQRFSKQSWQPISEMKLYNADCFLGFSLSLSCPVRKLQHSTALFRGPPKERREKQGKQGKTRSPALRAERTLFGLATLRRVKCQN